jgi:HEAT repeat protein
VKDALKNLIQCASGNGDTDERREAIIALGYEHDPEVFKTLLACLGDPSVRIRHAAVISLGRYGNSSAVAELSKPKIFRCPSSDIRMAAVTAIGQLGDFQVIEKLAEAVEDEEWVVRNQAVSELKRKIDDIIQKQERRAGQMLVHMLDLENAEVVEMVVQGLAAMGQPVVDLLLRAAGGSSPGMRASAAMALGVIGLSSFVPHLIPMLSDADWKVRRNAIQALGRIGDENAVEALVACIEDNTSEVQKQAVAALVDFGRLATEPILSALRHVRNKTVQRAMIRTLGEINDLRAIAELIRHLGSTYYVVRTAAIRTLVMYGDAAVPMLTATLSFNRSDIRPLMKDVHSSDDRQARIRAIRALGALEDHRAVDALKRAAVQSDAETAEAAERALFQIGTAAWGRCSALVCLREIGSRSALPSILEALRDPSNNVRLEALRALVKFPGEASIPPLMKLVAEEKDPYLRAEAIGVIRMNGTPHPGLADLGLARLADPDWNVRAQAAGLLGNLRMPGSLRPLLARFKDPHWSVQESAENALHNYGSDAVPILIRALHDRSPSVRVRAVRLLGEVANRDALDQLDNLARKKRESQEVLKEALEAGRKIRERHPNARIENSGPHLGLSRSEKFPESIGPARNPRAGRNSPTGSSPPKRGKE